MAAVTVTATNTNTRVNDSNSNTNWGNWGSSGGSPSSEGQIAYQGGLAVNKKINSTTLGGIDYDPGANALDMTAAANRLWLVKVIVADSFDLNATRGLVVGAGSANNAYRAWNLAGSASTNNAFLQYNPPQGGYVIVAIAPDVTFWHDGVVTSGSPSWTAVDWFGTQCAFINGAAKSENLALDAIDVGTGLQLYGGDGGDADGVFQDFVDEDEGTVNNRWGYASSSFGAIFLRGMMEIGTNNTTSTATEFTPPADEVVIFPDMFVDNGLIGLTCDLGSASTTINIPNSILGRGGLYNSGAIDTRPDLIFTGTSGTGNVTGNVTGHRNVTLTSAVTVDGAVIGCVLLTQSSANIEGNTIIQTDQVASTATLQDPTFGTTTDLHDTTFEQIGVGHAIELDTATTYNFTNIFFDGYGGTPGTNSTPASGATDAAVVNSSGGAVTINVTGGDSPSVRNTAGSTTTVNNTVNYVLTGIANPSEVTILDRDVSLLDITGTATDQNVGDVTANTKVGQSFQVTTAGKVERIRLNIKKVGNPTDGLRIRLVNGVPGSTETLISSYYDGADFTTSFVEYDINLDGKSNLALATTYGIEIERSGANDGSNYYAVQYDTSSVHANGTRYLNNGTWGSSTGDLLFSAMEAASDNELYHVESVTTGTTTYAHGGTAKEIEVLVASLNFYQVVLIDDIDTNPKSVPILQIPDLVYLNP